MGAVKNHHHDEICSREPLEEPNVPDYESSPSVHANAPAAAGAPLGAARAGEAAEALSPVVGGVVQGAPRQQEVAGPAVLADRLPGGDPSADPLYRIGLVRNGVERALATLFEHRSTSAEIPTRVLQQWHEDLCVSERAMRGPRAPLACGGEDAVSRAFELVALLRGFACYPKSAQCHEGLSNRFRESLGVAHDIMLDAADLIVILAQGTQLREDSRSEAEAEGLQPGPVEQDAP